ncbi:MAG: class I tRNA ligase family protein, partial [Desulfobacterales bacterium]|nr:class I tRNA ligase family protein [Desulfobacterales bacterium]
AAGAIYKFVWHEFCDWYLEIIKPVLYGKERPNERQSTLSVLWRVLHDILLLLHPFMPFVTEEIWHKLPETEGSIMKASFPVVAPDGSMVQKDPEAESKMEVITEIISGIRNIRGEMNIAPSLNLEASVQSQNKLKIETIRQYQDIIINLAGLKSFSVSEAEKKPKSSATAIVNEASIFVSLEGIIDFAKEAARLEKEINKLTKEISTVSNKLGNENFLNKAPADVVEKVKEKNMALLEKQQKLQANLEKIKRIRQGAGGG